MNIRKSNKVPCDNCGKLVKKRPSRVTHSKHTYCSRDCRDKARLNRISVPCSNCGKVFECPVARVHRKKENLYCSKACHRKPNGSSIVSCDTCGKTLKRYNSPNSSPSKRAHNYCNRECAAKGFSKHHKGERSALYKRVSATCDQCGTQFERIPSHLAKHKNIFCGETCADLFHSIAISGENHPFWKGGDINYYGPNWRPQRRLARKRDGYSCQVCGITEKKLRRQLDVHHIIAFRIFGIENYIEANQLINLISLCHDCHKSAEAGKIPFQPKLL